MKAVELAFLKHVVSEISVFVDEKRVHERLTKKKSNPVVHTATAALSSRRA